MKNIRKENLEAVSRVLEEQNIKGVNAFLGFDACVDKIVRVVKNINPDDKTAFYENSRQFGEFLINHAGKSCGIELQTLKTKIGGNMVISGNALGNLGIKSDCVGTFGYPEILPVFQSMSSNCKLFTVGETITTNAIEFNDSKIMMFDPGYYNVMNWEKIKEVLGINLIRQLFLGKQLVMLLNWSEIENSNDIWRGILKEVLSQSTPPVERAILLADFSDCSRKPSSEIQQALELLSGFRNHFKTILSLNLNEAEIVSKGFGIRGFVPDEKHIRMLYKLCKTDEIVVHHSKESSAFNGMEFKKCDTFFFDNPAILTGAGDNFNAGYCFSKFYKFSLLQSLLVANAVSGIYVKTGQSPSFNDLLSFLKEDRK